MYLLYVHISMDFSEKMSKRAHDDLLNELNVPPPTLESPLKKRESEKKKAKGSYAHEHAQHCIL